LEGVKKKSFKNLLKFSLKLYFSSDSKTGSSWPWSFGSWIYNYICNHCLSPLQLWVRTQFMARCTRYNIMW